ncbi:hypothetical protein LEP1GSC105_4314 [Leptospira interrogans str. UI 12758]|uniref:Uncharacterized protein n=1 Tax=Leptospira interrogans str. UI 12758 TaxID=1049938 RepID=A0A0E2DLM0_LEPIR|nr:hypothetical protein LEP1GSC105_4314 [Leptospira interrogans str. UI 12758]
MKDSKVLLLIENLRKKEYEKLKIQRSIDSVSEREKGISTKAREKADSSTRKK